MVVRLIVVLSGSAGHCTAGVMQAPVGRAGEDQGVNEDLLQWGLPPSADELLSRRRPLEGGRVGGEGIGVRRGPVLVDASHPGRYGHSTYRDIAEPNPTEVGNQSVVLSRFRRACRDQVGVPLLDVVGPRLLDLVFEVELVSRDRRRCLAWLVRPKENDPSSASMQVGEANRSGFVFVDELVEAAGRGAPG
jgi:hypothetical protein